MRKLLIIGMVLVVGLAGALALAFRNLDTYLTENRDLVAAEVAEVLGERRGSARTTVLTVMQRLTGKGYLTRRKQAGVHRYSTTEGRPAVIAGLIEQFVNRVLDGSPLPFVAYLAESKELSEEQASTLGGIVRDLEEKPEEEGQ